MKRLLLIIALVAPLLAPAQGKNGAQQFFDNLKKLCGKSYEGYVTEIAGNEDFLNKRLIMHVRSCEGDSVKIAFHVGDNKSRSWILVLDSNRVALKHDHRNINGTEDRISRYGGKSTNEGTANMQCFPADQATFDLVNYAASNIWWITIDENYFTYNLKRIGTDRAFAVTFDLRQTVKNPPAPWGWK